ncbi:gliding motility lipoprotein GldH [Flavobacteriaceae bacterium]|nr:gliding motility lipoprotein GldH [Flavobacteriaceae bacterium]
MLNKVQIIILCYLLLFVSCDSHQVFDEYKSVKGEWHSKNIIEFVFAPKDTIESYNMFINIRNNNDYKFNNLFLIAEMNFPNGKSVTDTLEYKMAKPTGELLGNGFSDVKENKLWYKERIIFDESGFYEIKLQQAMRENGNVDGVKTLNGITDIGLRIEKVIGY